MRHPNQKKFSLFRQWKEHPNEHQCVSKTKREYVPSEEREGFDPDKIEQLPAPKYLPHRQARSNDRAHFD